MRYSGKTWGGAGGIAKGKPRRGRSRVVVKGKSRGGI